MMHTSMGPVSRWVPREVTSLSIPHPGMGEHGGLDAQPMRVPEPHGLTELCPFIAFMFVSNYTFLCVTI